jgi:hypothetical protein
VGDAVDVGGGEVNRLAGLERPLDHGAAEPEALFTDAALGDGQRAR